MRTARDSALVSALVLLGGIAACQREPAPRDAALADFQRMEPAIRTLEHGVASGLSPLVELDPFGPCSDDACISRRVSDAGRLQAEIARFRREVVPGLVRATPVLGLEIVAHFGDAAVTIAEVQPVSPGKDQTTVPAARGVDPDLVEGRMGAPSRERRLGWGRYQTKFESNGRRRGDDTFHRGIELTWHTGGGSGSSPRQRVRIDVRAVLITDGFRRPAEWPSA